MTPSLNFNNLVFAGGGNRCFWQAGFWQTLSSEHDLNPKNIASVSAGSAISCALFSGCFENTLEKTKEVMSANNKNRYWNNLLKKEPIHPHTSLYRKIIKESLTEEGLKKLHQGPVNRILVAHIPPWLGPRSAVLLGLGCYQIEKKVAHPVHPKMGRKLGFQSEFILSTECQSIDELSHAMISSSCTPPFTPLMYRNQRPVLDGGMVDNVPVHGVEGLEGDTLVMLSRPYSRLPNRPGFTYVQPLKPVPIKSWDYTNPKAVQQTYQQGVEDAKSFLRTLG